MARRMIRAAFFDVDGTISPFNTRSMTDVTLEALYALQRKGVKVIVASGRPWYAIDNVRDFPFDAWISCNGGIATCNPVTPDGSLPLSERQGELVVDRPLDRETVRQLCHVVTRQRIPSFMFARSGSYINFLDDSARAIQQMIGIAVPPESDLERLAEEESVYEVTTYMTLEQEAELLHPLLRDVEYIRWHPAFTDVNPRGVSKAYAVEKVLDWYGFGREEAIAFGDGGNDIPMLDCCGTGVAMGNATDEVKAHASFVTLDVDNDGVAYALRELGVL